MYMQTLPPLHSPEVKQEFNEYKGVARTKLASTTQEPYGHVGDAIVMMTSVILCGIIYCVTMVF